jgi:DNA-binding response OmpR family regulator/HPt (histidine-containing phosphotransfer) domain-containing protein
MKILLIEDDDASIALLTRSLNAQHHIVDAVKDGEMGWTYASTFDYQAIVLDIMLPKLDGISLCKKLRGAGYTTPILLLTAQDNTTAKVQGLDAGADDYMVKPFETAELIARVRALLRRGSSNPLPLLSWGDLLLDPSSCEVSYNGQPLTLTTKEYDLLELFLRDSYRVFSSEEIIDRLWSSDEFPAEATVRSHIRRLRRKLQAAGAPPDSIATIHGRGYHLKSIQLLGRGDGGTGERACTVGGALPLALRSRSGDGGAGGLGNQGTIDRHHSVQLSQQQQYQAFLQDTWLTTKPQLQQRLTQLQEIVDRLAIGASSYPEQQQAHQAAHKLVGTLGVFTMMSAMEIARQIEVLLDRATVLAPTKATMLPNLVAKLVREIESTAPTQQRSLAVTSQMASAPSNLPLLLLVDLHPNLTQSLTTIATQRGCRTTILDTIAAAENYLATAVDDHLPMAILVGLEIDRLPSSGERPLFDFIHHVTRQCPVGVASPVENRVVLILSDRDELTARLDVVRHGGKFLGTGGLTIEQIFLAVTSLLQPANAPVKVMVVDDDLDWLRALPQLLAPWAMKVTTLADPHQFWTILQSVQPDALILDLKMPEINGFELCQVLRSDPHWRHLPILFLTATNDPISQQEAFKVGADDYLCKPIGGGELAQRIRHRLARLHA